MAAVWLRNHLADLISVPVIDRHRQLAIVVSEPMKKAGRIEISGRSQSKQSKLAYDRLRVRLTQNQNCPWR
jgi:hypothetical protein